MKRKLILACLCGILIGIYAGIEFQSRFIGQFFVTSDAIIASHQCKRTGIKSIKILKKKIVVFCSKNKKRKTIYL